MGYYSPIMWMEPETYAAILEDIIRPTIHQLALIGAPYTGLLYAGVIITETGPKALRVQLPLRRPRDAGHTAPPRLRPPGTDAGRRQRGSGRTRDRLVRGQGGLRRAGLGRLPRVIVVGG